VAILFWENDLLDPWEPPRSPVNDARGHDRAMAPLAPNANVTPRRRASVPLPEYDERRRRLVHGKTHASDNFSTAAAAAVMPNTSSVDARNKAVRRRVS